MNQKEMTDEELTKEMRVLLWKLVNKELERLNAVIAEQTEIITSLQKKSRYKRDLEDRD
jgi:hypothetical protein